MVNRIKPLAIAMIAMIAFNHIASGQGYDYFDTSFHSPVLDETKSMRIYLPPGYYFDTISYPIVYYLHGATGSYLEVDEYLQSLQNMIDTGYIHHMLVVGLDGQCDPFEGSMYTNSVLYGDYEDYIMQDAIPFAESVLRTKNSPNYRCIMGFAMGAYGSMKFAIKYYDEFAGVASYNGPLQFDTTLVLWLPEVILENPGPPHHYNYSAGVFSTLLFTGAGGFSPNIDILPYHVEFPYDTMGNIVDSVKKKWKEHDCSRLVKGLDSVPYHPGLFIGCGINDFLYFHPTNVCFIDTLDELGINYEFLTTDDGHVLSDEILAAGMYFLDSVMHDDFWIGNTEYFVQGTNALTVYPNPCSSMTNLRFTSHVSRFTRIDLYSISGRKIRELGNEEIQAGINEVQFDVSDLPDGVYFVRVYANKQVASLKLIVVKQ